MQKRTEQKINPQPIAPPLSCFSGENEYGPDFPGWYYQVPETTGGLTYNAPHPFNDPNAPGRIGEVYRGGIITSVWVEIKDGVSYWVIHTETNRESIDLRKIKTRVFWAAHSVQYYGGEDVPVGELVQDIYSLLAVIEGGPVELESQP